MKILASLLIFASVILAAPTTNVELVGVGDAPILADVYVSPYVLEVNGRDVAALCIDFNDESYIGTSWNAYLSVVGGDISHTYNPSDAVQYEQAAYIYSEITAPGITSQQRTDLQEAAWYIMNPNYANGNSSYGPDSQAMNLVTDAELHYNSINPSNYMIVSAEGSPRQQEFMIPVTRPEPAVSHCLGVQC